jgi:hypothetical protein
MRRWQNYFWDTISRIEGYGTNTKIIKTETLLHFNLEIFFHLFIFYFFQSSLCLSHACSAYSWLVHYLSLFIYFKLLFLHLFVCLFCFFPVWWDKDTTSSQTLKPGLEDEGLTSKLLKLKLYCTWTWRFSFSSLFHLPLAVSLMPV